MRKLFPILIILFSFAACDNYGDFNSLLNQNIVEFIQKEYRDATIRSTEYDDQGLFEVEIRHDSHIKEVYFDYNDNWVYTTWDVRVSDLPSAVKAAVSAKYPGYRIDDADFYESVEKSYYRIEIERGEIEKTIYITKDGNQQ